MKADFSIGLQAWQLWLFGGDSLFLNLSLFDVPSGVPSGVPFGLLLNTIYEMLKTVFKFCSVNFFLSYSCLPS